MIPAPAFESWLSTATRKLARDGAERVRAEIGEHYQYTLDSGATPEQAIAALGDPKQANRDYRKVFLTESEVRSAPDDTQLKQCLRKLLILLAWAAAWNYFVRPIVFTSVSTFVSTSIIWALIWGEAPLHLFYPLKTTARSLKYLVWSVRSALTILAVWGLAEHGLAGLVAPAIIVCTLTHHDYKRSIIFRKLGGKPAPPFVPRPLPGQPRLLPGQPSLTRCEAVFLSQMPRARWREFALRAVMFPFIGLMALAAVVAPLLFGPLTAMFALRFVLPCVLNFYTAARSRRLLKAKLTLLALGVILPPFQFLMPNFSRSGKPLPIGLVLSFMVIPLVIFFVYEYWKISLRRKLPVEEWPKALYL